MINKRDAKRIVLICIAVLIISGVCCIFFCLSRFAPEPDSGDTESVGAENNLIITNLDVGKADSAIIQYNDTVGIIDVGTEEAFNVIDTFLKKQDIKSIDYMILTHYDQDHIGSAVEIIDSYDIGTLYIPDYVSSKKYYDELMAEIGSLDNVYYVDSLMVFYMEDIRVEVIPADDSEALISDEDNVDNNMSLLTKFVYGSKSFLFMGDVEKDRIAQILDSDYELSADWIKLPHHNDFTKKVEKLLSEVKPEYAISSTGDERPVEDDMVTYMEENNIKHFITSNGNVITVCDGENITCQYATQ